MAGEIHIIGPTGRTCYVHIFNASGQRWNGSSYETFVVGNYADYDISVTEDGSTGIYRGDIPSSLPSGRPDIVLFVQAGGSPANGDRAVGAQSLNWSGSSVSSGSTPLGALTGSQMKDYVVSSGFVRTDMDDEIYDAITDTIMEMEQAFRFDEREVESTTTDTITVQGDYKINVESDMGHIVSVELLDGDTSKPLDRISKQVYDLRYTTPPSAENLGYPEAYALYGGKIYIGPPPESTDYQYRMSYSQRLTSIVDSSTDPVPFSAQYREALKDGTLYRLFGKNLKQWDIATPYKNEFAESMDRIMKKERRNRSGAGMTTYRDV